MQAWDVVRKFESEDGTRSVEIRVSADGKLFRFYEHVWTAAADDELLYYPDGGFWSCPQVSGYYASVDECVNDARLAICWLPNM
ncbi:MAG: hypothetical protein HLUCCA08_07635 [Rhodobacteraceae bacterium HLUCCA08]|nr:MAG: hypothetical protein HLUCCA08_07635 [Rhodobacteraceae bacterium HLUCCA08]